MRSPWSSALKLKKERSFRLPLSPTMQKTRCGYLFLTKWVFKHISWWGLGMRRLHRGTQHSIAQLEQKKTFRLGFLHFRARRESKGSLPLNDSAWIHTFGHTYLQYLTDICIHVHNSNYILDCALAQTDQDWRSFLDCQTPTHPEGNDECFRAHGSEQNMHGAGAICHRDR